MNARYSRLPVLLVTVALAFFIGACSDGRHGTNPGDVAPQIEGVDVAGAPISLHSIQGKVVVVNFWATWCGPCMAELPALQELHDTLKARGLRVVGIAVDDTPENIRSAKERFGITYPLIVDTKASSKRSFGIRGLPETFVLDAQHRVLIIQDPSDGGLVTKIVGPREWAKKRSLQSFEALLQ